LLTGTLIYPLAGNWLWGGGWLSNLGANLGLGHGLVDFGGASVVFLTGSTVALVALILFRPATSRAGQEPAEDEVVVAAGIDEHLTVYDESSDLTEEVLPPQVTPMPSAYLPILSLLGGGLMLLGWFGLTTGVHAPTAVNFSPAQAAVNGLLAALASALTAAGYSWFTTRELNPLMTSRGLVAGLIVATAGAPFIPTWIFVMAGLLVGLLLPLLIYLFNQGLRLADESGTLATYGVSAIASLLLVAFFANGQMGQGWNGAGLVDYVGVAGQGVSGLVVAPGFAADWPGQLQAQLLGLGIILVWALLLSFLLFQTVIAVADAWARTGLELADSSSAPAAATQPEGGEATEDHTDTQLTINN
jgi:Amt family ammonium transporter